MAKKKKDTASDELKPQDLTGDQKNALEKRAAKNNELGELIGGKITPMLTGFVKRTDKTKTSSTGSEKKTGTGREATMPVDEVETFSEAEMPVDSPETQPVEVREETNDDTKDESGSFFGLSFDWSKMEKDPFAELVKFFEEDTREDVKEDIREEQAEGPMVIVADFTLPYRCCEDYVCEDMCYTDEELKNLAIPPFAKDDFAVTRKNVPVDIYPDMNDSHVFKGYIVVKEIEDEKEFSTTAGGKVTPGKGGAHPHFIYTPPRDRAGVSDSFLYTLYNTRNELSDTATVWIEVAESVPTFSISPTTVCRNAKEQPINVDPKENEWNTIEVNGHGITKTVDAGTGAATWTFNPSGTGVIIGVNTITLTLNGRKIDSIDITVTEILADFKNTGELTFPEGETRGGMIILHDQSLNGVNYFWEWRANPRDPMNTSTYRPGEDRNVFLPLVNVPAGTGTFILPVKLTVTSPVGCIDQKEINVTITRPRVEPGVPEITTTTNQLCSDSSSIVIAVDAKGNAWADIELVGNGVTKTTDGSGVPTWRFTPKSTGVVIGPNRLVLKLNGSEVDSLSINVMESTADFVTHGQAYFNDPGMPGGFVMLQDNSTNAMNNNWKWTSKYGSGKQDILPDPRSKFVRIPYPALPVNAETFEMTLVLSVISAQGCQSSRSGMVEVIIIRQTNVRSVDVAKDYLLVADELLEEPEALRQLGISQSSLDKMEDEVSKALEQFNNTASVEEIKNESFDNSINAFASAISLITKNASPEEFGQNAAYMTLLNSLTMASFAMLTIRSSDVTNNPKITSAEKVVRGISDKMIEGGYQADAKTRADFAALLDEVDVSKTELRKSYQKRNDFYNKA